MIATQTVMVIALCMVSGILIPLGLMIFMKLKYRVSLKVFFIGCATMLVFALILEQILHSLVLGGAAGSVIKGNVYLYALYGGLMAGLFEETGRFLSMRFLMKKEREKKGAALMYGAGHGGFETFMILGIGMINNLIYSVMLNAGQIDKLMAPLDEANKAVLSQSLNALASTPWQTFLLSPVERIGALAAQLGLSVIIWQAVKQTKIRVKYYLLAIVLHLALDAGAVILSGLGLSVILIEAAVYVMAAVIIAIAVKVSGGAAE